MDGTGELFGPFIEALPEESKVTIVRYPTEEVQGLEGLVRVVEASVPGNEPYCIVAESFSGPVAIQFASKHPKRLRAMVLCATFCSNPLAKGLRWVGQLAHPKFFQPTLPRLVVRRYFVSDTSSNELVESVRSAVKMVAPEVLASRAKLMLSVDVATELKQIKTPVLCLTGGKDRIVGKRGKAQVEIALPGAQFETLEGPHLLLQCLPKQSVEAILGFLNEGR